MTSSSSFKRRLFDSSASGASLLCLDYGVQVTAVTSTERANGYGIHGRHL